MKNLVLVLLACSSLVACTSAYDSDSDFGSDSFAEPTPYEYGDEYGYEYGYSETEQHPTKPSEEFVEPEQYEEEIDVETEAFIRPTRYYEEGCPMLDDHEAFRRCVIKTYYRNKPRTFVPARLLDGRSVAIIRNGQTTFYDGQANAYEAERVMVIETIEKVTPITETVVTTTQTAQNAGTTSTNNTQTATVTVKNTPPKTVIVQEKEKTWWDTYHQDKQKAKPIKPQCPCLDPNEPCPQCVEK